MTPPLILLCNDDGIHSEGLGALREALEALGDLWVVAPETEQSATSHSMTMHRALRVRDLGQHRFTVDGTPTDCAYLALHKLLPRRPDLLVSGINHGGNLGDDVLYSGTVAAAMEGALHGIRALAVSRVGRPRVAQDFAVAARFARALAEHMLQDAGSPGQVLNVNVPSSATLQSPFEFCALGKHSWKAAVEERTDPRGRPYYWIGGPWLGYEEIPGTDCTAVARGHISVTPLRVSLTDTAALQGMTSISQLPGFTCARPAGPPPERS